MKKTLLLSSILIAAVPTALAEYVTLGDGTEYTLDALSQIAESGVTKDGSTYVMLDNVTIAEGDKFAIEDGVTVKMGDGVQLRIEGEASLEAATAVTVTRNADTDSPEGIGLFSEAKDVTVVEGINFEYAGLRAWTTKEVVVRDCSFKYCNGEISSAGALSMAESGGLLDVSGCEFIENAVPAIGGAANFNYGVVIEDCYFYDNNTENANKPQLNITVGGDRDIVIRNNTIVGNERNKVGAIAVSNMLGASGSNNVLIEGNDMRKHRYGITTNGAMNVRIIDNEIVDNKYESNAMNGGSGISIYDSNYNQTAVITGNHIEGNLWGITVIGGGNVNIGKTEDSSAEDYNPGGNVFVDNGNGGVLYDLYNNGQNTIYAQGNKWNVAEQTEELIETVITHKNDIASLGEVIFMPPMGSSSVTDVATQGCYFDSLGKQVVAAAVGDGAQVEVYAASGALVARRSIVGGTADLSDLTSGVYVVVVTSDSGNETVLKCCL